MKRVFTEKELEMIKSLNQEQDESNTYIIDINHSKKILDYFNDKIVFPKYDLPVINNSICIESCLGSLLLFKKSENQFSEDFSGYLKNENISFKIVKFKELKNETVQFYIRITSKNYIKEFKIEPRSI